MRPNWFLACPLPAAAGWQAAAAAAPAGLRRYVASDLHLTVAFLGPCDPEQALRAWSRLAGRRVAPIAIKAAAWQALGPPGRPSAYGFTLADGREATAALLSDWGAAALEAAGLASASRRTLPHVTLLRPRRREAEALQAPMRAWMAAAQLPPETALLSELALYTWAEARTQRLFRIQQRRPLAGGGGGTDWERGPV